MRTVKKPEIRKQEILEGAMEVFLSKGFEKTTIADISRGLDISQGLCYRYFPSKEEIYAAVIDTCAAAIVEENLKKRPQTQTIFQWIDCIPGLLKSMEQAEREDMRMYALLHDPQNKRMHQELCMKVGEQLLPSVTKVLEQAQERGEISLTDCRKTAAFGIYGEIGLLMAEGMGCSDAIQENWRRLLGIKE